jgi:hypothetical protein
MGDAHGGCAGGRAARGKYRSLAPLLRVAVAPAPAPVTSI